MAKPAAKKLLQPEVIDIVPDHVARAVMETVLPLARKHAEKCVCSECHQPEAVKPDQVIRN